MNNVSVLSLTKPKGNVEFLAQVDARHIHLDLGDLALNLFTDFNLTPAISVLATTQIDNALTQMICSGVRLLFVVDAEFKLMGVITSYDIQGEKPMRYLQSRDCRIGICAREDILVQDIMTPLSKWQVIDYSQLRHATIGDLLITFKESGQRHLIVVDTVKGDNGGGSQVLRGLLSQTTLERALGTTIETNKAANSFAELKRELAF